MMPIYQARHCPAQVGSCQRVGRVACGCRLSIQTWPTGVVIWSSPQVGGLVRLNIFNIDFQFPSDLQGGSSMISIFTSVLRDSESQEKRQKTRHFRFNVQLHDQPKRCSNVCVCAKFYQMQYFPGLKLQPKVEEQDRVSRWPGVLHGCYRGLR